jgi:hypothetical protein
MFATVYLEGRCQNDRIFHLVKRLKNIILANIHFIVLTNILLGVDTQHGCEGAFPGKEGGIQVWAGQAPSSNIVGSLLKKTGLPDGKMKIAN